MLHGHLLFVIDLFWNRKLRHREGINKMTKLSKSFYLSKWYMTCFHKITIFINLYGCMKFMKYFVVVSKFRQCLLLSEKYTIFTFAVAKVYKHSSVSATPSAAAALLSQLVWN